MVFRSSIAFIPDLVDENEQPDFLLRRAEPVEFARVELDVGIVEIVKLRETVCCARARR